MTSDEASDLARAYAERIAGPPWIFGRRGSPLEAPENTLASLRRALDLSLDGLAYEVRACASDELVVFADERLERTTDGTGEVGEKPWVELEALDAGGWFGARFRGEPIPLVEEALDLRGDEPRANPLHWIEIDRADVVPELARAVHAADLTRAVRVASGRRDACLDARDAGLAAVFLAARATSQERDFVRAERLAGIALGPGAFETRGLDWPCERFGRALDRPEDLWSACKEPVFGFSTHEPLRALAVRALVALAPHDAGPYPIQVPELLVDAEPGAARAGEWFGRWAVSARVRNPFAFAVSVTTGVVLRRGAFEIDGLPRRFDLAPSAALDVPFTLAGGARVPGGDPQFFATFEWRKGPGRPAGRLRLDAPLARVRTAIADRVPSRLRMLRESPHDAEASMTLRRHRGAILVSIEATGGLEEPRTVVSLAGKTYWGGRGVRAPLPEKFDQARDGVAFSCGMVSVARGERVVRRWAGGVPDELSAGAAGRLFAHPTG